VQATLPAVRVKIPCDDARDFDARLAGHIAVKGLRIPSETRRPIGTRLRVALELRNGETLCGDAFVDGHVQIDARPGMSVRFVRPPGPEEPTPVGAEDLVTDEPREAPPVTDEPREAPPDAPPPLPGAPADALGSSAEILAAANRQVGRLLGGVAGLAALALVLAATGYAVGLQLARRSPAAIAAARVAAADRLLAEGRVLGKDGALEELLAARDARPKDPVVAARLTAIAGLLESLGARAIDRGDLAVASVHLAAAALADPTRESVRAKLAFVAAKERTGEARPRPRTTRQRR
jgi:hypothetical protein